MTADNKVGFIGGFVMTIITNFPDTELIQSALVGLIGGFFGLLGKQLFYFIKKHLK